MTKTKKEANMKRKEIIQKLLTRIGAFTPDTMANFYSLFQRNDQEWFNELDNLIKKERRWKEENGVIYFTLPPTKGISGAQWIKHLELKKFEPLYDAKKVLLSSYFNPTAGVINKVVILKDILFSGNEIKTSEIRALARSRNLTEPNPEVACLIREYLADWEIKTMRIKWIVTMHNPIAGHCLAPFSGRPWGHNILECVSCTTKEEWRQCKWEHNEYGFAFIEI